MTSAKPKITVLYHYMYPDDVVSARHFDGFCEELVARGWDVEALPSNRGCRDETQKYPRFTDWNGIKIRRVWRPGLKQATALGRIGNASWMILAWSTIAFRNKSNLPQVVVVGTDPVLSVLVAIFIKRLRPQIKIAHWCYDMYPEAPIAEGMMRDGSLLVSAIKRLLRSAYASCDMVVDLGSCMRRLLETYGHTCRKATLVPWALYEPGEPAKSDAETRRKLFNDSPLTLLYSGNFGRAHSFGEILALARELRSDNIRFCFSVRGNREAELRAAVKDEDTNISFADFASEAELGKRLGAADIHLASLRPNWTGVVVPSKFFGSLAAGRPVIFEGSPNSSLAQLIKEYKVGWVLDRDSMGQVASELKSLAHARENLMELQEHCHRVYQKHFSKRLTMDAWDHELRELICQKGYSKK